MPRLSAPSRSKPDLALPAQPRHATTCRTGRSWPTQPRPAGRATPSPTLLRRTDPCPRFRASLAAPRVTMPSKAMLPRLASRAVHCRPRPPRHARPSLPHHASHTLLWQNRPPGPCHTRAATPDDPCVPDLGLTDHVRLARPAMPRAARTRQPVPTLPATPFPGPSSRGVRPLRRQPGLALPTQPIPVPPLHARPAPPSLRRTNPA